MRLHGAWRAGPACFCLLSVLFDDEMAAEFQLRPLFQQNTDQNRTADDAIGLNFNSSGRVLPCMEAGYALTVDVGRLQLFHFKLKDES